MEKPFEHNLPEQQNSDIEHSLEETVVTPFEETIGSPALSSKTEDANASANLGRRNFIRGGVASLVGLAMGAMSSSAEGKDPKKTTANKETEKGDMEREEKEEKLDDFAMVDASEYEKVANTVSPEQQEKLLKKIGLHRNEVKPEFLNKYFEGAYKALVIIDLDPPTRQALNAYDSDGNKIIDDAEVSSGRLGMKPSMETPKGSTESEKAKRDYVNKEGIDMPYAVGIDTKNGIYMHKGSLPGFPGSHGCVRLKEDIAKKLFELATEDEDLLIVIR